MPSCRYGCSTDGMGAQSDPKEWAINGAAETLLVPNILSSKSGRPSLKGLKESNISGGVCGL